MDIEFDHSYLSLPELHVLGIRSTVWLEQALEDSYSKVFEITGPNDPNPIFFKVGFCDDTLPVLYVFEFADWVISRQARKATKEEIRQFWCG
ncbi:hypothetical protein RT717_24620 [Imperialibacter roseus]|uniref:Uncharacterized protein n=1 Tax=Imperialibacter roseus TaxID=1324217 RepID=A0ABZ0IP81_9BACT|nr:hypothetical protein [Imperialibacter roseus]WOK06263.1 hypothetical protein RT717_24620 [Imperialibacter roseus]